MKPTALTVTATFEDGLLRPDAPLPLSPNQRVTISVLVSGESDDWPEDVAEIYREIAEEDRRIAAAMSPARSELLRVVRRTL